MLTLQQLNAATPAEFELALEGIYEHSPWVAAGAAHKRPFRSIAHLKRALVESVRASGREAQLRLIRAHPELAGKAMVAGSLTAASAGEQSQAGLSHCSPEEFHRLKKLNDDYNARFGFPFILAVRGPRANGLTRHEIIETFARRLLNAPESELAECLRNIDRIVELRLNDRFGFSPELGNRVWDWAEKLAVHSEPGYREQGQLTVTYLTDAHRACGAQLQDWMRECGFDEIHTDALGNVVGVYRSARPEARTLLTGSHYDTVRNGGRYDGRLGILVPMACVRELALRGRRLAFHLEVVGFAEEEGQRYNAAFLGSSALAGCFDPAWLEQRDADGRSMREAMRAAGLPGAMEAITALKREPARYLGFVEVHIEQGPVLSDEGLPLGVVNSINGSVRCIAEVTGVAGHAGATPMNRRRDAAAAVAELALYLERRAAADGDSVGTIGMLNVPAGSINVVPGRCQFSLDLRAPTDAQRDRLAADVLAELAAICGRRGVRSRVEETLRVAAAPSAPDWQSRWEKAVAHLGLPVHRMASGAGHDAMKLHEVMPQAMLFLRGGNSGISHNPLETVTNDDAQLCVEAFLSLLDQLDAELA